MVSTAIINAEDPFQAHSVPEIKDPRGCIHPLNDTAVVKVFTDYPALSELAMVENFEGFEFVSKDSEAGN
jgi:hypothetical protein